MALSSCTATVDVIANLSDAPVPDGTKTVEQFKDAFDQAGREIKGYLNNTLIGEIESQFQTKLSGTNQVGTAVIADGAITADKIDDTQVTAAKLATNAVETAKILDGNVTYAKLNTDAKSKALTGTADAADWSQVGTVYVQAVGIAGLAASDNIIVSPAPASFRDWRDSGVYCSSQSSLGITLTCDTLPTNDIDVQVLVVR